MSTNTSQTRASLLLRLTDGSDREAWDLFADIYAPAIYHAARRLGLQAADAEDCVQEVFLAVANSIGRWLEREDRGAFRPWLFRIARNTAIDLLTRRQHRSIASAEASDTAKLDELAASSDISSCFDIEYRREVFARASEIVQQRVTESSWQAFYRTAVLHHPIQEVADHLGMSVGSIYIARSRVMKRLQEIVRAFEDTSDE